MSFGRGLGGTSFGGASLGSAAGFAPKPVDSYKPEATDVNITGITIVGETITGNYTYVSSRSVAEGTSLYKWYRADDNIGTNKTEIVGAVNSTHVLAIDDMDKYISFEVVVIDINLVVGDAVESAYAQISFNFAGATIVQDTVLEHDTNQGLHNSLIMIDDAHAILAYQGLNGAGYIKTFSVDALNNFIKLDELVYSSVATYNSLEIIDSTHFILSYIGVDNYGYIITFSIDNFYNIVKINELEHETYSSLGGHITILDSTHFVLAYGAGQVSDSGRTYGTIKIFEIDISYNILEISALIYNSLSSHWFDITMIDDTHCVVANDAYNAGYDNYLTIFSINELYAITKISEFTHDVVGGRYNNLIMLGDAHFALSYSQSGTNGYIKTFLVNDTYSISQTDSFEFESGAATYHSLIGLGNDFLMLAYQGVDTDGYICIFGIDNSYIISEYNITEHDVANNIYNSLAKIDTTRYALAYGGIDNDGYIKTFELV